MNAHTPECCDILVYDIMETLGLEVPFKKPVIEIYSLIIGYSLR